jgi:hypothetical protein
LSPLDLLVALPSSLGNKVAALLVSMATELKSMPTELGRLFLSAPPRTTALATTSVDLAPSAKLSLLNSESATSASEPSTYLLEDRLELLLLLLSPSPLPVSPLLSLLALLFSWILPETA